MTDQPIDRDSDGYLPVTTIDHATRLWPALQDSGSMAGHAWTSWPLATTEDRILFLRCRDKAAVQLSEMMGEPIRLSRLVVHRITVTADDGEISNDFLRPTLIDAAGRRIGTSSAGILQDLQQILWAYGGNLPPEGVTVRGRIEPTKNGRKRHTLEVCEDQTWPMKGDNGARSK
jgi:hypothetical protein